MKTRVWVLVLAFGLLMAACSSSDDSGGGVASLDDTAAIAGDADATLAEDVDTEQAMMDLAACLRDQGLDIEDPTVDAEGNVEFGGFRSGASDGEPPADRDTMRAAMDSCQEELGGVVLGFGGDDFDRTELEDTMVEYAACMRDNGYDMSDPDFSSTGPGGGGEAGEGGGGGPFGAIDRDDPDFVAADAQCSDILSGLPRVPGGGRGNG